MVSGQTPDAEVLAQLAASALVGKQSQISLQREAVLQAFREALAQIEAEGKEVGYTAVAYHAHRIYGEALSEGARPGQGAFRALVSGQTADSEVLALLAASALVGKRSKISLQREAVLQALREALAQIEAEGKEVNYQVVADHAHRIYCEALPEGERPSQGTFRQLVTGQKAAPEVLALLAASALVRKRRRAF